MRKRFRRTLRRNGLHRMRPSWSMTFRIMLRALTRIGRASAWIWLLVICWVGILLSKRPLHGSTFRLNISSIHVETLSEYFAEEEVEAAMLEADLAMYTDECALVCDEGLDLVELAQEEVSIDGKRGFEF